MTTAETATVTVHLLHAGFVEVLEHHVERLLGFKLQVL